MKKGVYEWCIRTDVLYTVDVYTAFVCLCGFGGDRGCIHVAVIYYNIYKPVYMLDVYTGWFRFAQPIFLLSFSLSLRKKKNYRYGNFI